MAGVRTFHFEPRNGARYIIWGFTALIFALMPLIFSKAYAITTMSVMGIGIIFALSYNMLLGQTGMLSFGHAVYSGLAAFVCIHVLNWVGAGKLWLPVSMLPLVGGLAGAFFGVLFGYVSTKKAGTPFAMITLGIGEMVFASTLMFPSFSGGEGGLTTNRVIGEPFLGISFGPQIQVYYLIAIWCIISMAAMYALTHTPLGRMANAVRENPERVEFIGYDTHRVRFYMLVVSSFFAGIAGGLNVINLEAVTPENVHATRSGLVLLAAFIGGALFYFGPILGAIVMVLFTAILSDYTKTYELYLGLFFVGMVMFAPGGISSIILMNLRVAKFGKFRRLCDPYVGIIAGAVLLTLGVAFLIELLHHVRLDSASGHSLKWFGFQWATNEASTWVMLASLWIGGLWVFETMRRAFHAEWNLIQEEIEDEQRKQVIL